MIIFIRNCEIHLKCAPQWTVAYNAVLYVDKYVSLDT